MLTNPIEEGSFEANVVSEALGFQPLVTKYLLTLGEKLLVEARLLDELVLAARLGFL